MTKIEHKFTIDRQVWARGTREDVNFLLGSDGKMCCIGIFLKSLGVQDEVLLHRGSPVFVPRIPKKAQFLVDPRSSEDRRIASSSCIALVTVNDNAECSDSREEIIKREFLSHGIEVEFTGE